MRRKPGVGRLVILLATPGRRLGKTGAGEVHFGGGLDHQGRGLRAEDLEEALARVGNGGGDQQRLSSGVQVKVARRMRERVMSDERGDVLQFGGFGLEELATRRRIEEEVSDGDRSALRQTGLIDAQYLAAGDLDDGARCVFGGAGFGARRGQRSR